MKTPIRLSSVILSGAAAAALAGCFQIKTENEIKPIEVKPIHITVDINVKVDRALEDFFGDLDEAESGKKAAEEKSGK